MNNIIKNIFFYCLLFLLMFFLFMFFVSINNPMISFLFFIGMIPIVYILGFAK